MKKFKDLLVIALSICFSGCFNCPNWRSEMIAPMFLEGTVVAIDDLPNTCNGRIVIEVLANELDTIEGCNCGLAADFWSAVAIGDKLLKPIGETQITLSRSNWSMTYDFPCCDH